MKTFANIKEDELVLKINKIVDNLTMATSLTKFSQDIREFDNEINKPNYLKNETEKKDFINKIKSHNEYSTVINSKDVLVKLIHNDYFEFLLPYALSNNDMAEYKNIELTGLGFYEENEDIISI